MSRRSPAGWVRLVNLALFLFGAGALIWMIRESEDLGLGMLRDLGGWSALILGTSLAEIALKAKAIHVFMRPEQRMVSYPRVLAAQFAGQAIGSVTPTGVAGEIAKATLLMGHAPRYRAVSSVVSFNIVSTLISAAFLLFAIALTLRYGDLSDEAEHGLRATFLVLLGVLALLAWMIHRGLARTFLQLLGATRLLGSERRARLMERLHAFDAQVDLFRKQQQNSAHGSGFVYVLLARVLGWVDLWIIMLALGEGRGFVFTVFAAATGMIVGSLATIVPLGLGVAEGGQAGLFELLGPGAAVGLAVGLIRRFRALVIAVAGILLMLAVQLYDYVVITRSKARIRSGPQPEPGAAGP